MITEGSGRRARQWYTCASLNPAFDGQDELDAGHAHELTRHLHMSAFTKSGHASYFAVGCAADITRVLFYIFVVIFVVLIILGLVAARRV